MNCAIDVAFSASPGPTWGSVPATRASPPLDITISTYFTFRATPKQRKAVVDSLPLLLTAFLWLTETPSCSTSFRTVGFGRDVKLIPFSFELYQRRLFVVVFVPSRERARPHYSRHKHDIQGNCALQCVYYRVNDWNVLIPSPHCRHVK